MSWLSWFGRGVFRRLQTRLHAVDRAWVAELGRDIPGTKAVLANQFRPVGTWQIADTRVRLYQRHLV